MKLCSYLQSFRVHGVLVSLMPDLKISTFRKLIKDLKFFQIGHLEMVYYLVYKTTLYTHQITIGGETLFQIFAPIDLLEKIRNLNMSIILQHSVHAPYSIRDSSLEGIQ
jgi:hypothetical protein